MTDSGWRTVLIDCKADLRIKENALVVRKENEIKEIPLSQVHVLIIDNKLSTLSTALLLKLNEQNIRVVFCDEKHNPLMETVSYNSNTMFPDNLSKQIKWSNKIKVEIFGTIINNKIQNQIDVLKINSVPYNSKIEKYLGEINIEEISNRESQVARLYFNSLFGKDFRRRTENNINAALNYGYSLILSSVNKAVALQGYSTSIGINHHNCKNPYNLSCDIMEVFRPFVDDVVFKNRNNTFNLEYREVLLNLLYSSVYFDNKKTTLINAVQMYTDSVLRSLLNEENKVVGVYFAKK